MGGVIAPVRGSGPCPAWIAFVAKRIGIAERPRRRGAKKVCASRAAGEVLDHVDAGDDPFELGLLPDDDCGGAAEEELVDRLEVGPRLDDPDPLLPDPRGAPRPPL